MFSPTSMPSTASIFSMYTTFTALVMLIRTVLDEVQTMISKFIPQKLKEKITSSLEGLFGNFSSQLTLVINEYKGYSFNEIYQASEVYLSTIITPSIKQLKVSRVPSEKSISVTVDKGQKIIDTFEGVQLVWEFVSTDRPQTIDYESSSLFSEKSEHKSFLLSFHKKHKDKVLNFYLPYVVERSKAIQNENKVIKLHSIGSKNRGEIIRGAIILDHPSTFETLAMDTVLKKELIDDLDRFVKRRDFYRRVGKAWKRGYLLYGPPGTGKSSLIAAMANYLKFDIYDMDLTTLRSNSDLIPLLTATKNRSILVIEDIDCSIEIQNRQYGEDYESDSKLTLSGLLNFIDGLWSSCGDERIIVFTTNYKDRLDPALLRPGRMDMHIHMSYCNPSMFKILAFNYLKIKSHCLFRKIEQLIKEVEVTPAEVAEELIRSEVVDTALEGLTRLLHNKKEMKKCEESESKGEECKAINENDEEKGKQENGGEIMQEESEEKQEK